MPKVSTILKSTLLFLILISFLLLLNITLSKKVFAQGQVCGCWNAGDPTYGGGTMPFNCCTCCCNICPDAPGGPSGCHTCPAQSTPTPTPTPVPPNCYNLSGPSTINLGSSGTYTASFTGQQGLFDNTGLVIINGSNCSSTVFAPISAPGGSPPVTNSFTWTPSAAGTYTAYCRSWNATTAECRGICATCPACIPCAGPTTSMSITVIAPTGTPVPTPTSSQNQCEQQGGFCVSVTLPLLGCPPGFINPLGTIGQLGCNITKRCCRPQTSGCYVAGYSRPCQTGFARCSAPNRDTCCVDTNGDGIPEGCPGSSSSGGVGPSQFYCNPSNPLSGIDSAIGCIPYANMNNFAAFMLVWFMGLGGGIAFLMMLYGGFLLITSAGNPGRVKMGRVILVSAISGLSFIVFSVFLLRTIGVDILHIPNF